jgi:cyclase
MVRMITEQAPGIYSVEHSTAEGKNAVIIGSRVALVVDCGKHPEEGQAMADFIRAQGYTPDRVILTHGHDDHILGGQVFAGSDVFAQAQTPAVIRRQLNILAERTGEPYDTLAARALWPTITFTDELGIDVGDLQVHLFPTPGHSEDGISLYIEAYRALIAGDSVVTGIVPALWDGDSRVLEASLRKLALMNIDVLIPGHGPVLHGEDRVRDWLLWLAGYLANVRAFAYAALVANPEIDAVALTESTAYDQFIGDRLPVDKHNMPQRHQTTVLHIIAEERAAGRSSAY